MPVVQTYGQLHVSAYVISSEFLWREKRVAAEVWELDDREATASENRAKEEISEKLQMSQNKFPKNSPSHTTTQPHAHKLYRYTVHVNML